MPTLEERLQALEQKHTELEKTIELQTIAIGALVNKATLEKLNERYNKLFDSLITHDRLTNEQLTELRTQQLKVDGKIVGLQTEIRQHFAEQDSKITKLGNRITGLETTQTEHTTLLQQILARLPEKP